MDGRTVGEHQRTELLRRAVTLTAEFDALVLDEVFTPDAEVWASGVTLTSREEIAAELRARDEAFADLSVEIGYVDVVGEHGWAEWVATATHVAPLVAADGVVEATGEAITVRGVTVADFDGDRITSLRQYWDEVGLLEGLGVLRGDA